MYVQKMNGDSENPESSSGRFLQTVRPLRDLESNWTVDLAKNLEEYLLKICSGQISGDEDTIFSVNFAEAALLLQGSVQVYSRKVEYLYSLVVHALTFISQKSPEEQAAGPSAQPDSSAHSAKDEGDDSFWGLDDIPVEAKSLLDSAIGKDTPSSHFVRPPANLVVLEGECLDVGGDAGELESYLLATSDLYRDFILLDTCDAVVVDSFLDSKAGKWPPSVYKGNSVASRGHKTFQSPSRLGTAQKSAKKKNDANIPQSPCVDQRFESNDCNIGCSSPAFDIPAENDFGMADAYSEPGGMDNFDDDDEDDDPWKPLNPHEPGNLKVKPYKKVKAKMKLDVGSRKHRPLAAEFPPAKLSGPISTELTEIWEAKLSASENFGKPQSLPLYEKLRQSLVLGEMKTNDAFSSPENNNEDNGYDSEDPDTGPPDFDMPDNNTCNPEDVPPFQDKCEDPDTHENLSDLCRSHLDSLLATLAENEKQTEMAARVSTWKQRIEQNLEEQDARPSFDIHKYGERVLDKLSKESDDEHALSFTDVVKGQEKHDVARTFSALLQLVNNGDVDLVRSSAVISPVCYTNVAPFYVRLLKNEKGAPPLRVSKKRAKSPLMKGYAKPKSSKGKENNPDVNSSPPGSDSSQRLSMDLRKGSRARCTPQGKKRRKSRLVAPLEMNFVG
ncbi:hypothetical protein ACS0TY_023047 [Phlomoides rotata]